MLTPARTSTSTSNVIEELAQCLMLGTLLEQVRRRWGGYELIEHWPQGEFHHDLVLKLPECASVEPGGEGGGVLVVATNCNGGVKEVLCFAEIPDRLALWHWRCRDNPEFAGELGPILAFARTEHWFDPCELLSPDARSEYREQFRQRQCGGGWLPKKSS